MCCRHTAHAIYFVINCFRGALMDVLDNIKQQIAENPVILFMKGSPNAPQCGFSMRTSQAVMACGQRFAYVDVLSNPEIRAELPKYANWPTFPQLWVKGELIGGCDIVTEMHEKGELKPLIDSAIATN
jgi:monothiol glutaredoxin